jgi:cytochrome c biogenesis protein CcdA
MEKKENLMYQVQQKTSEKTGVFVQIIALQFFFLLTLILFTTNIISLHRDTRDFMGVLILIIIFITNIFQFFRTFILGRSLKKAKKKLEKAIWEEEFREKEGKK